MEDEYDSNSKNNHNSRYVTIGKTNKKRNLEVEQKLAVFFP